MKFRKKPVVIEAFNDELQDKWPEWFCDAIDSGKAEEVGGGGQFNIHTLEGIVHASAGDWIIKGIKGELYACKPDIFEATYEKVEDK